MYKKAKHYTQESVYQFDYKDTKGLLRYITEMGKILPKRITGLDIIHQHQLAQAIKRARFMALLSYTEKSKG